MKKFYRSRLNDERERARGLDEFASINYWDSVCLQKAFYVGVILDIYDFISCGYGLGCVSKTNSFK